MFISVHLFRQFSGPPEVMSLLTPFQGRSAGITMKPFKGFV